MLHSPESTSTINRLLGRLISPKDKKKKRENQMTMPFQSLKLHFVFIPLMCPGHLIPMVDMGRLLAQHSVTVTIVTTPLNAVRFKSIIDRDITSGIQIRLLQL